MKINEKLKANIKAVIISNSRKKNKNTLMFKYI